MYGHVALIHVLDGWKLSPSLLDRALDLQKKSKKKDDDPR